MLLILFSRYCGLDTNLITSLMVGFLVMTWCSFHGPIRFLQNTLAALGMKKIGQSSMQYRVSLFLPKPQQKAFGLHYNIFSDGCFLDSPALEMFENTACATVLSTHVFVTPATEVPLTLLEEFRRFLQKLH